jgi:hypothetical protein
MIILNLKNRGEYEIIKKNISTNFIFSAYDG